MHTIMLSGLALFAAATPLTEETCAMDISFETLQDQSQWSAVNDGVMGGLSSGGPSFDGGALIFSGEINTNGGGFSSIRYPIAEGDIGSATGLHLRVKSDGRAYRVTLRTLALYRARHVSFQMDIPQTPPGEWTDVRVNFDDARASLRGSRVADAIFIPEDAWELGLIIADKTDGPFRLDVQHIKSCH